MKKVRERSLKRPEGRREGGWGYWGMGRKIYAPKDGGGVPKIW